MKITTHYTLHFTSGLDEQFKAGELSQPLTSTSLKPLF